MAKSTMSRHLAVLKQMVSVEDEGKVKLTAHGKDSLFRKADEAGI